MYELEEKSMEYTLHEVYRGKICDLQAQLRNKDIAIEELKSLVTKRCKPLCS